MPKHNRINRLAAGACNVRSISYGLLHGLAVIPSNERIDMTSTESTEQHLTSGEPMNLAPSASASERNE